MEATGPTESQLEVREPIWSKQDKQVQLEIQESLMGVNMTDRSNWKYRSLMEATGTDRSTLEVQEPDEANRGPNRANLEVREPDEATGP
ncbi:hypothetical protein [Thomasclavelia cocleata]|uniref:hypothetical protein n=1 Tax=Thomasclavelia cocleata TaxID=69824 RepID=UPI001B80A627|nr:hypothetical protein [Thomasclavelia cocleata]